jgi:hypothetical protein
MPMNRECLSVEKLVESVSIAANNLKPLQLGFVVEKLASFVVENVSRKVGIRKLNN